MSPDFCGPKGAPQPPAGVRLQLPNRLGCPVHPRRSARGRWGAAARSLASGVPAGCLACPLGTAIHMPQPLAGGDCERLRASRFEEGGSSRTSAPPAQNLRRRRSQIRDGARLLERVQEARLEPVTAASSCPLLPPTTTEPHRIHTPWVRRRLQRTYLCVVGGEPGTAVAVQADLDTSVARASGAGPLTAERSSTWSGSDGIGVARSCSPGALPSKSCPPRGASNRPARRTGSGSSRAEARRSPRRGRRRRPGRP